MAPAADPAEQRWRYLLQRVVDGFATADELTEFAAARAARLARFVG